MKELIVVMGICGSGKSTIGQRLAKNLEVPFIDADDFHPQVNVKKMSRGEPLTDDDRWPWLAAIVEYVLDSHRPRIVLACSALKHSYREYLEQRLQLRLLFLDLSREEAIRRLNERQNHFMQANMVDSQLATLERPKNALTLSATESPEAITAKATDFFSISTPNA